MFSSCVGKILEHVNVYTILFFFFLQTMALLLDSTTIRHEIHLIPNTSTKRILMNISINIKSIDLLKVFEKKKNSVRYNKYMSFNI